MKHLSEVLKILDGALKSNHSMAANYAGLLADKLDLSGNRREATMIRERLARTPAALAMAQSGHAGPSLATLPVDGESRLHTVDISQPDAKQVRLILPSGIESRMKDFLAGVEHHDELVAAGAAMPNRMVIYGPPGTGKTQTARWIAAQLEVPMLTVRCDTLISSLLGQTSRNLRRVFEYAQEMPCVLFLDEFDALAGARGNERDVGELQRVVIALLQNIDALPDSTILLAATNHDQLLDHAIWRRFSFRIPMPLPDETLRSALWVQFLGNYAPPDLDTHKLAELCEGASGALIEQVCLDAKRSAILSAKPFVEPTELLRRLGLTMALNQGKVLASVEDEVRWLRQWLPKYFSYRVLAMAYGVSNRQIMNAIKEDNNGNPGDTNKSRQSGQPVSAHPVPAWGQVGT